MADPVVPLKPWELAYRAWRAAADRGYGPRTKTPAQMERVDRYVRRLKDRYEELLLAARADLHAVPVSSKEDQCKPGLPTTGSSPATAGT